MPDTMMNKYLSVFLILAFIISGCERKKVKVVHEKMTCNLSETDKKIRFTIRNNPMNFDSTAFMKIYLNNKTVYCNRYSNVVHINYDTSCKVGCGIMVEVLANDRIYMFGDKDTYQIKDSGNSIYAVFTHDNADNMVFTVVNECH